MIDKLKTYSLFIVVSLILVIINKSLESDYLITFLKKDLVTILIALLAINTTTASVVMTKLREISDKNQIDFSRTITELKHSMMEQVAYIMLAVSNMVLMGSRWVLNICNYTEILLEIILVSVFIAALYNLYDAANSIFIILRHEKR